MEAHLTTNSSPSALVVTDEARPHRKIGSVDRYDRARVATMAARRLQEMNPRGRMSAKELAKIAAANGIATETLRRYVREGVPEPKERQAAIATEAHRDLVVEFGDMKAAWRFLSEGGRYDHSYATFIRGLDRLIGRNGREGLLYGQDGIDKMSLFGTFPREDRDGRWAFDHQQADFFIIPDKGHVPFRPWVTAVRHSRTSMILALIAWPDEPNAVRVVAALATAMAGEVYIYKGREVFVGGLPEVINCDNALEHVGDAVKHFAATFGAAVEPIIPGRKHLNGSAENVHVQVTRGLRRKRMPGFVGVKRADGSPRYYTLTPKGAVSPKGLWSFRKFQQTLDEVRRNYNVAAVDNNPTPIERWIDADDDVARPDPSLLRRALLREDGKRRTIRPYGVMFDATKYMPEQSIDLGTSVTVRWLPGITDFIEIYSADGKAYLTRAYRHDKLPAVARANLIAARQNAQTHVEAATAAMDRNRSDASFTHEEIEAGHMAAEAVKSAKAPRSERTAMRVTKPRGTHKAVEAVTQADTEAWSMLAESTQEVA